MSLPVLPVAGRAYICGMVLEEETYWCGWAADEVGVVVVKVTPIKRMVICNVFYPS